MHPWHAVLITTSNSSVAKLFLHRECCELCAAAHAGLLSTVCGGGKRGDWSSLHERLHFPVITQLFCQVTRRQNCPALLRSSFLKFLILNTSQGERGLHACHNICSEVRGPEDDALEVILSVHQGDSMDRAHSVKLGGKCVSLSCLGSPPLQSYDVM